MGTLSRAGALRFVESGTKEAVGFFLWLHDYAPAHRQHVNDLLALLNVEAATSDEDIFLEVVSRLHTRGARTVSIETRSVYDLGQIGAAAVDVPEADRLARLTTEYPKPGLSGVNITIRRARLRAS